MAILCRTEGNTKSGQGGATFGVWVWLAAEAAPGGQSDGCSEARLRALGRKYQTPTIAPNLV